MTYKENITAILECNFSGFKEEIIDIACNRILEQESKTEQFAKWVATEIFDDMWEYNKDAFDELACRKLAKLGIVVRMGDEWELVEPQESEDKCKNCEYYRNPDYTRCHECKAESEDRNE